MNSFSRFSYRFATFLVSLVGHTHFLKAVGAYASWGYFDPGESNYRDGYQCPPINWGINTERKQAFFKLLKDITEV